VQSIVAALYVDTRGHYPRMAGVEAWDAARDATRYVGPYTVVAHPPCGPWSKMRHLYRGDEAHIGPIAVAQVRRWGGVLEQPAHSKLWEHCELPPPGARDSKGIAIAVDQCAYGHVARKPTWLYLVGVDLAPGEPRIGGEPTHACSGGGRNWRGASGGRRLKICSAEQRRRTPPAFAAWLVSLARRARVTR
jgi:hypothetical protein